MTIYNRGKCLHCKWWVKLDTGHTELLTPGVEVGHCHRHSPSVFAFGETSTRTSWPLTPSTGFCGDMEENEP